MTSKVKDGGMPEVGISEEEQLRLLERRMEVDGGGSEQQMELARMLLKRADTASDEDVEKNTKKAIHLLIINSKSGNEEATQLLQDCLEKNVGIDESKLGEIRWCLQTPTYEKLARKAARDMFRRMSPASAGTSQTHLSRADFLRGLDSLGFNKAERSLLEKAGKVSKEEVISEDVFVEKAVRRLTGKGGVTTSSLLQKDVEWEVYTTAPWLKKVTKYPGKTLSWIADHAVEVTGKQGLSWLRSMVPTHQIYMLLVFFVYSLMSVQVVLWFLPLFVFYVSLSAMVVCTLQMFYSKRRLVDVHAMAGMLKRFNEALDCDTVESTYTWNSLTPYVVYFISLVTCVASFCMADHTWIPCAEIIFVAGFFTVSCFFGLSNRFDFLSLLSIGCDSVSMLPLVLENFPQIPILYHAVNLVGGSLYSVQVYEGISVEIGLPSAAFMVVPLLFIRMAMKNSWKGTYKVLVPHLVCFFWWRLAVLFFRASSWLGLLRASVGWICFIVLLPVLLVLVVFYAVYYFTCVFTISNLLKVVTTVTLLAIPAGVAFWAKSGVKFKGVRVDTKSTKVKVALACIFALSILPFTYIMTPPERDVQGNYVTWEQYRDLCSKPRWDKTNMAESMVMCTHLSKTMVQWTGRVKKIVVKKIDNQAEAFMDLLPWSLGNWLKCTYGDEYPECNTISDPALSQICRFNVQQGRLCHMKNLNRYTFEVWVLMPLEGTDQVHEVRIEANHWFQEVLLKISDQEEVHFRASLISELGNVWPVLKLYHIECTSCSETVTLGTSSLKLKMMESYGLLHQLVEGLRGIWNFFLNPVIKFSARNLTVI